MNPSDKSVATCICRMVTGLGDSKRGMGNMEKDGEKELRNSDATNSQHKSQT